MLLSLSIKNFALIESLDIDFSNKFSIITGETGAGKSILLGALGLVLGNRADLTSLKNKEQKCIIEAHFLITNYNLKDFFVSNDLDYEDLTIIRREILPSGKSRAFINDSPVNLSELQDLASYLIDIHSQHQTRDLLEEAYQFEILDAIANHKEVLLEYRKELNILREVKKELKNAITENESLSKEQEYNLFLLEELLAAKLKVGELQVLEEELDKLNNVEFIKENLDRIALINNQEEIGLIDNLSEVKNAITKLSSFSKEYAAIHERISSLLIELKDINSECIELNEKIVNDPERLEYVNSKLQLIHSLLIKHQVQTIEELLDIQNLLDEKVQKKDSLNSLITKLESNVAAAQEKVNQLAKTLTKNRVENAPILAKKIENIIALLGMPDAKMEFQVDEIDNYNSYGNNSIVLNFSANKGLSMGAIKKVASGGEMSRIMLAVKAILANYTKLPTIIFDEIDTGVSGEIALKMADIMKQMSDKMQVFAITHLPQIAAKGDQHYKVLKYTEQDTTLSELKLLTDEERIVEIAEMLSGKSITDSALIHAKSLLN